MPLPMKIGSAMEQSCKAPQNKNQNSKIVVPLWRRVVKFHKRIDQNSANSCFLESVLYNVGGNSHL